MESPKSSCISSCSSSSSFLSCPKCSVPSLPKTKIVTAVIPHDGPLKRGTEEYKNYKKEYSAQYYQETRKFTALAKMKHNPRAMLLRVTQINFLEEFEQKDIYAGLPEEVIAHVDKIVEIMTSLKK